MSRWPSELEQRYRQHESDQRMARVERVMEQRRREWARTAPLPEPIVDRDPGDEQ